MATPFGAVLAADGQVMHLGRDRSVLQVDPQAMGHDAADIGDGIHPLPLSNGRLAR